MFNSRRPSTTTSHQRPSTSAEVRNRRAMFVSAVRSSANDPPLPGQPSVWKSLDETSNAPNVEWNQLTAASTATVTTPVQMQMTSLSQRQSPTAVENGERETIAGTPTTINESSTSSPKKRRKGVRFEKVKYNTGEERPVEEESSTAERSAASDSTTTTGRPKRKFKSIAKSLSVLSRAGLTEPPKVMSREQHAFLSKYGMHMENAAGQQPAQFEGTKWEYIRQKLIIDPTSDFYQNWTGVVAAAYVYNLLIIVFRCVFLNITVEWYWLAMLVAFDLLTDGVYLVDMFFRSRTGFLEQGLLVRDIRKTWRVYKKSWQFKSDILSIIPIDYLFELAMRTTNPIFRFNRLFRLDRFQFFLNSTETRISVPNAFRVGCVVMYILVLIHWNACAYFFMSDVVGLGADQWVYGKRNIQSLPPNVEDTLGRRYVYSIYWSTLVLTTVGEVPWPVRSSEFIFVTVDLMCGVLIFATIVGNVGSMISNMSAARSEFQNRVDGIKQYMDIRCVGAELEQRVIKWFDYLWSNKQTLSDQQVLNVLPARLQAEIAMHVHFETLRKVRIFQDCEAGLLAELVLKLQLQVFSPKDYVCRKGDIGREMYIVKRGRLQVVGDDGVTVFHTIGEGAVFGELSILNIAGSKQGNRRSASIRSVGYTDLFVLKKSDLWDALKEYPDARKVLIQKVFCKFCEEKVQGREILQKDNLLDESAPLETKTAEEIAEELQSLVNYLQTRLARLTAEHISYEAKLRSRLDYLESELRRNGDEGFFDEEMAKATAEKEFALDLS